MTNVEIIAQMMRIVERSNAVVIIAVGGKLENVPQRKSGTPTPTIIPAIKVGDVLI